MNVLSKKRLTSAQRSKVNHYVSTHYEKIKSAHEDLIVKRLLFFCLLGLSEVLHEQLGYGKDRRKRFLDAFVEKVNAISQMCCDNKCEYQDGKVDYDTDYNRELLSRMAAQYDIKFDESIFDDTFEE